MSYTIRHAAFLFEARDSGCLDMMAMTPYEYDIMSSFSAGVQEGRELGKKKEGEVNKTTDPRDLIKPRNFKSFAD